MKKENLKQLHIKTQRLCVQWSMFTELYLREENYYVFARTGEKFWGELESLLLDSIFLGISRLLDSPKTGQRENLSLRGLLDITIDESIRSRWESQIDLLDELWRSGVKIWRDKYISHNDLEFSAKIKSLPNVPFSDIDKMINLISVLVCNITKDEFMYEIAFIPPSTHWVSTTLKYLKLGVNTKDD